MPAILFDFFVVFYDIVFYFQVDFCDFSCFLVTFLQGAQNFCDFGILV